MILISKANALAELIYNADFENQCQNRMRSLNILCIAIYFERRCVQYIGVQDKCIFFERRCVKDDVRSMHRSGIDGF